MMSQWLSSPHHPAAQTRECWLTDRLLARLAGDGCDDDQRRLLRRQRHAAASVRGPVRHDDAALRGRAERAGLQRGHCARHRRGACPAHQGHAGKTYRPTGPALLSPQDIAAIVGKVLGRTVKYADPPGMVGGDA